MRSLGVVPVKVLGDVGPSCCHTVIGHQVHPLVLHAAPQPLDKHVVPPGPLAIHGELTALLENGHGEFFRRELTALIGVDDFWLAELGKRFLNDLPGMARLQRNSDLVGEYPATGNIHHRREIHKPLGHGNVGGIQRPDLVGPHDR